MTDEQRARLRVGIGEVVRAGLSGQPGVRADPDHSVLSGEAGEPYTEIAVVVTHPGSHRRYPPLTTAQQLALSVLVGDEGVLPQAIADYLLDQGHEYATAIRQAERERVLAIIEYAKWYMSSEVFDELSVAVDSGQPANPKAFYSSATQRV